MLAKDADAEEDPYAGGESGWPLEVWDLNAIRKPRLLWGHTSWIMCADVTSDGRHALTGSWGRLLRLWDLDTGECLQILRGHRGIVFDCAITDDARLAISGSEDMTVRLWDLEQGKLLFTFAVSSAVTACDIARDGSVAMAGEASGRVHTFVVDGRNGPPAERVQRRD
jgi:WD40 repeat protein